MKFAQSALVTLAFVASSAFAQDPAPAQNPLPAPDVKAVPTTPPENMPLVPLTPEVVAASHKKFYSALREQVAKARASGAITAEQYAEISKSWAQLSDELIHSADDAARVSSYLGDNYFVFGILVTYGYEYILGANKRINAAGPSIEVGGAFFINSNFQPVATGVLLGSFAVEQSWDVNAVQNRSQPDRGWKTKLLIAGKRVTNISGFSGAYIGGGLDTSNMITVKGYVGGCFNSDEFVHSELKAKGSLYESDAAYNKAWQAPYNFVRERLANCNSGMVSISRGQNKDTPPWSLVEKGIYLTFPASNRGFGYGWSEAWKALQRGVWE